MAFPGFSTFLSPLALSLVLVAALACDADAPTETRAPAGPTTVGAGSGDDPDFSAGDISTMAIGLPVNQSVSTVSPSPAFKIVQTGSGPDGIFQISNSSSSQIALQGLTNGRGRAGFFRITNSASTAAALMAQTNSIAPAFQAVTGGSVSSFSAAPTANAGLFQVTNSSNLSPALWATTAGPGPAGRFEQTNAGPSFAAMEVACNSGFCRGLRVLNAASGQAALIINTGAANTEPALWVRSDASAAFGLLVSGRTELGGNLQVGSLPFRPANSVFNGDVDINGTLTKDAGAFKIDHPLDPEHKTLSHSFVESPDMKNVYDGTVTLDAEGRATVELPEYFEALNRDFRYQLTAIGAPGPNLYIAQGVQQNRFQIAGGRPYAHVSWQVTGIRKDRYAEEHRIRVEEDKPELLTKR